MRKIEDVCGSTLAGVPRGRVLQAACVALDAALDVVVRADFQLLEAVAWPGLVVGEPPVDAGADPPLTDPLGVPPVTEDIRAVVMAVQAGAAHGLDVRDARQLAGTMHWLAGVVPAASPARLLATTAARLAEAAAEPGPPTAALRAAMNACAQVLTLAGESSDRAEAQVCAVVGPLLAVR